MSMLSFEFWPRESRRILQRFAIVCIVALVISVLLWQLNTRTQRLDVQLVYSFAISTLIWVLTDVGQLMLFYRAGELHSPSAKFRIIFLVSATLLGYGLGTAIGDAYLGQSTWDLLRSDTSRFTMVLGGSMLISLAFIAYFHFQHSISSAQRQVTESRLKLLESQLEPHMLFNTLANLRALIQTDSAKAITMLDALNNYLRATLSGSRERWHPLSDEFARLQDYLGLMQVRMGARLSFTMDCPAPLSHCPIPPLLLQPIVENAIKHGLEPAIAGGVLHIAAKQVGDQLVLTVSDTGLGGVTQTQLAASKGFGLVQVQERLENVYGTRSQLTVEQSTGYSTCIQISLPWSNAQ